jgi:hypothetical protein
VRVPRENVAPESNTAPLLRETARKGATTMRRRFKCDPKWITVAYPAHCGAQLPDGNKLRRARVLLPCDKASTALVAVTAKRPNATQRHLIRKIRLDPHTRAFCGHPRLMVWTVVRKNSTTLMQREPGGCTRDEVHSGPGAPQLGLIDRNDVSGVANARGNLAADRAGPAPKKSVVGRDCNAGAKSAGFFADAPRSRE